MAPTEPRADRKHETRDIDVALISKLVGFGVLGTALVLFAMFWLFNAVRDREVARDPLISPFAAEPEPFAGPVLQDNPPRELSELFEHENALMESYGWVDREAGVVRIPVERAMELLLERGFPMEPGR